METENDPLLSKEPQIEAHPRDRGNFVYIIFYILGIGTLLPWNFFSTAKQYFMYKFRNTTTENLTSELGDPENETDLQVMFESYLTLAAMIPNVLFMFLNTAATRWISQQVRIIIAALVMIIMFALAISLTLIDTDTWQKTFFAITIASIIVMNAGSAVLQGAIFGLSGMFPKQYTQSVMGGMGMGGSIAAVSNIIAISIGSNPLESGFGYFLCAEFVLIIALVGYLLMPMSIFARYYSVDARKRALTQSVTDTETDYSTSVNTSGSVSTSATDCPSTLLVQPEHSSLWQIFLKVWMYAICVFITFFITISCYPAVNSAIKSTSEAGLWSDKYFMPVTCFLIFNLGDWFGRTIAGPLHWPREGSVLIPIFCFLRIGFIPLFMLCNVQPRTHLPVLFEHDAIPIVLMILFSVSNGFLGTLCMMYGPRLLEKPWDMERAGALLAFTLSVGLGMGSLLSFTIVKIA